MYKAIIIPTQHTHETGITKFQTIMIAWPYLNALSSPLLQSAGKVPGPSTSKPAAKLASRLLVSNRKRKCQRFDQDSVQRFCKSLTPPAHSLKTQRSSLSAFVLRRRQRESTSGRPTVAPGRPELRMVACEATCKPLRVSEGYVGGIERVSGGQWGLVIKVYEAEVAGKSANGARQHDTWRVCN